MDRFCNKKAEGNETLQAFILSAFYFIFAAPRLRLCEFLL